MFENKKIFILGMARSGYEVSKLLQKHHNQILITDQKEQDEKKKEELESLGILYKTSNHPEDLLEQDYDYVVKNPGVPKDHPCILKAKSLNIPVIGELEVAYHFLPDNTKIIGITGSNGKTTVTTMLYDILKQANQKVYLAGNIGIPLSKTVTEMEKDSILVIEISDHQLLDMYHFKTDISILTNISEVHLDFHGSYENYKQTKKKIFQNHQQNSIAILNYDNEEVINLTEDIVSKKIYFSKKDKKDAYLNDGWIYIHDKKFINISDICLQGEHNYENIMCVLLALDMFDVDSEVIKKYLKQFKGVEHRIEFVEEVKGRLFYNDSKSTNTESTITALKSFDKPIILLLGGYDRGHSFDPLAKYMNHVKKIISFGETKVRVKRFAESQNIPSISVENVIDATKAAYLNAEEGDVILLSPACASWDQYTCFEHRGNEFKQTVRTLE